MAKGKKKGKGKKKKGKKSEKKKLKELSLQEQALEDSEFWEAKYQVLEDTKNDFRENAQKIAVENDLLENQMMQTEIDTIDVVTFLKREDTKKDHKIESLKAELKSCRRRFRNEKQTLINDFNDDISKLEVQISSKQDEIHLMQNELAHVKEFRKKRALMQRELDEIRDTMFLSNREHREEICRTEQKFLEETISLQKEADQKISELGDRAHHEAMINLDETTKVVYKENKTLSQQLAENIKRGECLKKMQVRLKEENILLKAEKDNSEATIERKRQESSKQKTKLHEMMRKVEMLEGVLNHMIREFNQEKSDLLNSTNEFHHETRVELAWLQQSVISKSEECARVRKLARKILSERSDIERFFLESLQTVREEINNNQLQYKKAAGRAYNKRMLAAFAGQGHFPRVRTFNKTDTSTNSVFQDLQAAEMLADTSGSVDIADLTWEQKEKVLRYLFARMNGVDKLQKPVEPSVKEREELPLKPANQLSIDSRGNTAIGVIGADPYYDQQALERQDSFSKHAVLPDIGQATQTQAITAS